MTVSAPESDPRRGAWAALHDPRTDAVTLAAIAGAYPEFAEAIARHPNAYPALREWATAHIGAGVGGAPGVASGVRDGHGAWWIAVLIALIVFPRVADAIEIFGVGDYESQRPLLMVVGILPYALLLAVSCDCSF